MKLTNVIFRKWKHNSDLIDAYFPDIIENGLVLCYDIVGGHSSADLKYCLNITEEAKPEEYKTLKEHLENEVGYKLNIIESDL